MLKDNSILHILFSILRPSPLSSISVEMKYEELNCPSTLLFSNKTIFIPKPAALESEVDVKVETSIITTEDDK